MLRALVDKGENKSPSAAASAPGGAGPGADVPAEEKETAEEAETHEKAEENHEGEEEQALEESEEDPNVDVD